MRILLKIAHSSPHWNAASKPSPLSMMNLATEIPTLSLSTMIASSVLPNPVPLARTYRGVHGVRNTLGSCLTVFLQSGCGNSTCFLRSYTLPAQCLTRYAHGQRVICSMPDNIQILDFAGSMHASSPGDHEMFLRSNPSCIENSESIFVEDVVTHLPYYTVNRPINQQFFAYMIDEERIIGLTVCAMLKNDVDQFVSEPCFLDHFFRTSRVTLICAIVALKFPISFFKCMNPVAFNHPFHHYVFIVLLGYLFQFERQHQAAAVHDG